MNIFIIDKIVFTSKRLMEQDYRVTVIDKNSRGALFNTKGLGMKQKNNFNVKSVKKSRIILKFLFEYMFNIIPMRFLFSYTLIIVAKRV